MAKLKTGVVAGQISGRAGNAVFVATAGGTVLRDRPIVNDPRTQAQQAQRDRMAQAGRAWQNLSPTEVAAWRTYASQLGQQSASPPPSAQREFSRLAVRYLALNPQSPLPTLPPTSGFPGDAVRFAVRALTGAIEIVANRANAPGVITEVLIQRLPSRNCRTYLEKYRSAGYHVFTADEAHRIPVRRGAVAVATRFLDPTTGQATELIEWSVVVVG